MRVICYPYLFLILFLQVIIFPAYSQQVTSAIKALGLVHPSYKNVIRCFPEFTEKNLEENFNLKELKDRIDQKYVTIKKVLQYRKIKYVDDAGQKKVLYLNISKEKTKINYQLSLDLVDEKNNHAPQQISKAHQLNPSQAVINQYLATARIQEEENSYEEHKSSNKILIFVKRNSDVIELKLSDKLKQKSLSCELRESLVLCVCK